MHGHDELWQKWRKGFKVWYRKKKFWKSYETLEDSVLNMPKTGKDNNIGVNKLHFAEYSFELW
jgi:hypothetical protein